MEYPKIYLALDNCFALKRWVEPETWLPLIKDLGYTCTVNVPYSGGELNSRYGKPEAGIESVMLEINKKLFMDVRTFKKTDNFENIRATLKKLMQKISEHARNRIAGKV